MKLAINPNADEDIIENLIDTALVEEVSYILDLSEETHDALREAISDAFGQFLIGHYEAQNAVPEYIENEALKKVEECAKELRDHLNNLLNVGNAEKRLNEHIESMKNIDRDLPSGLRLRELITSIQVAAEHAQDLPFQIEPAKTPEEEIIISIIENTYNPDEDEQKRKARKNARKTPKDLAIRNSILILKTFFGNHVTHPFTAGKYYSEIGFKSPAFFAIKTVLKKIYPQVSDRKIASIMQEIVSQ